MYMSADSAPQDERIGLCSGVKQKRYGWIVNHTTCVSRLEAAPTGVMRDEIAALRYTALAKTTKERFPIGVGNDK